MRKSNGGNMFLQKFLRSKSSSSNKGDKKGRERTRYLNLMKALSEEPDSGLRRQLYESHRLNQDQPRSHERVLVQ